MEWLFKAFFKQFLTFSGDIFTYLLIFSRI